MTAVAQHDEPAPAATNGQPNHDKVQHYIGKLLRALLDYRIVNLTALQCLQEAIRSKQPLRRKLRILCGLVEDTV